MMPNRFDDTHKSKDAGYLLQMQPNQASLHSCKDEQWDSSGCCRLCLSDRGTEACEKSKTMVARVCKKGQRFLLQDFHSRRDGFPSKDFVFNEQDNDSALLSGKDVRSTMCGLNILDMFTFAMFPKNRLALYIISFLLYHHDCTCNESESCKCRSAKWKIHWYVNSYLLGDRKKACFVAQSDGTG